MEIGLSGVIGQNVTSRVTMEQELEYAHALIRHQKMVDPTALDKIPTTCFVSLNHVQVSFNIYFFFTSVGSPTEGELGPGLKTNVETKPQHKAIF